MATLASKAGQATALTKLKALKTPSDLESAAETLLKYLQDRPANVKEFYFALNKEIQASYAGGSAKSATQLKALTAPSELQSAADVFLKYLPVKDQPAHVKEFYDTLNKNLREFEKASA